MIDLVVSIIPYAITYTIPLLAAALGGLFSERSGVVNIGLEGLMVVGGFGTALAVSLLEPLVGNTLALVLGMGAGVLLATLFSVLHAFASVTLNANQVISGTAINLIASAVTVFVARNITGSGNIRILNFQPTDLPFLSDIPLLGAFFSRTYPTTLLALVLLGLSWYVLYKTPFGLRLRACGENPHAADAAGVNVHKVRYAGVLLSGAFAGLGGATMLVTYANEFNGSVAGLGFLSLAALIFGQWKPLGILAATAFFGFAMTMANSAQAIPELRVIPEVVLKIFPYVITLVALVFFSKTSSAPRAAGEPFDKGQR